MMKTVPSGSLEVCMNGAFAVLGTIGVTIDAMPVRVGSPVTPIIEAVVLVPVVVAPVVVEVPEDVLALVVPSVEDSAAD